MIVKIVKKEDFLRAGLLNLDKIPFISPLFDTITPALSLKYMKYPSRLLHGFLCLTIPAYNTFFLKSGLPFCKKLKPYHLLKLKEVCLRQLEFFWRRKIFNVLAQKFLHNL